LIIDAKHAQHQSEYSFCQDPTLNMSEKGEHATSCTSIATAFRLSDLSLERRCSLVGLTGSVQQDAGTALRDLSVVWQRRRGDRIIRELIITISI